MTKLTYLFSTVIVLIKRERVTAIFAVILLVVSMLCSLFLLSYGYTQAENVKQKSIQSCSWIFDIDSSSISKIDKFIKELDDKYELRSSTIIGTCEVPVFTSEGQITTSVEIACELFNPDVFICDYGKSYFGEGENIFLCGDIGKVYNEVVVNNHILKVIGIGSHNYNALISDLYDIKYYVSLVTYNYIKPKTEKVVIVFKNALLQEEYSKLIDLVSEYFSVTEIFAPDINDNKEIQKTQLIAAFFIICISFINIFSVFSYFFVKIKADYKIMRLCGASIDYIFFSAIFLYSTIILFSFVISCALYKIFSMFLINTTFYYRLNLYIIFICLIFEIIPSGFCLRKLKKLCGERL